MSVVDEFFKQACFGLPVLTAFFDFVEPMPENVNPLLQPVLGWSFMAKLFTEFFYTGFGLLQCFLKQAQRLGGQFL